MMAAAPMRLAILISGRGSNMGALLRACASGILPAVPVAVISDRAEAPGLEVARGLGVAAHGFTRSADGPPQESFLTAALEQARPDVIALAGFMRILSPAFVRRYLGRMLNIHPSLLPAYTGLHTHRRVLAAGDATHGASVHFVTPELDAGPVVLQSKISVLPGDTASTLAARVLATEHVIYPKAIGWFAQRRLRWQDGAAWLDGVKLDVPPVEDFRDTATA
jgi:phosphoribosylglycinamide formyltransferase-1